MLEQVRRLSHLSVRVSVCLVATRLFPNDFEEDLLYSCSVKPCCIASESFSSVVIIECRNKIRRDTQMLRKNSPISGLQHKAQFGLNPDLKVE